LGARIDASLQTKLGEFHRAMGVPILPTPQVPSDDRVRLRCRLILEECLEFIESCVDVGEGQPWHVSFKSAALNFAAAIDKSAVRVDLPLAADALADIAYVVEGSNLEFGIDSGPVLDEVQRANMAKANGPRRADGKVMKPEGWTAPDIAGVLERQKAEQ